MSRIVGSQYDGDTKVMAKGGHGLQENGGTVMKIAQMNDIGAKLYEEVFDGFADCVGLMSEIHVAHPVKIQEGGFFQLGSRGDRASREHPLVAHRVHVLGRDQGASFPQATSQAVITAPKRGPGLGRRLGGFHEGGAQRLAAITGGRGAGFPSALVLPRTKARQGYEDGLALELADAHHPLDGIPAAGPGALCASRSDRLVFVKGSARPT